MTGSSKRKWFIRAGVVLASVSFGVGAISVVRSFLTAGERPRQIVHNISLIKQPPPPPPKPPDKPPDPPKVREEVKIEEQPKPADKPDDAKPASDKSLALDAQGGAGSDGFGLAGRVGGADLLASGGGGAYYTGLLQRQLFESLMRSKELKGHQFQVLVRIELGADGKVQRSELLSGSGDKDIDRKIETALSETPALKEVPPANLRTVEIRLTNRV
jgi:periplasmic protein TonB